MFKVHQKKITVFLGLMAVIIIGVAANAPKEPKRNLKVLPKDITHEELDKVMKGFNAALGVKCNFCHAASKTEERKLDFASDEKAEKGVARKMYQMTGKINKKFFSFNPEVKAGKVMAVTCVTCHRGNPHPSEVGGEPKPAEPKPQGSR